MSVTNSPPACIDNYDYQKRSKLYRTNMKNIVRIPLLLVYVVALIALYIFSVDKYSWMREIDTSLSPDMINNDTSNQAPLASLAFIFILAVQLLLFFLEKQKKYKIIAVTLSLIAATIYIAGYFRLL